ncbi:MAG: hypothetical protein JW395_0756 [Nitrospira sp.]|nr:hypothetical protein [Nitrospira sp.]
MSSRETLNLASSAERTAVFTALAWERLPEFLNSRAPNEWWLEPSFSVRILSEFAELIRLDVIQVPAVRRTTVPRPAVAGADSAAAVECVSQLSVIGTRATMAVVPSIDLLQIASPGTATEDLEDELRDLVSDLLNAGADAICVHGISIGRIEETIDGLSGVVRHFGRVLVGLTSNSAVSATDRIDVSAIRIGDPWPSAGLVLATGDLSQESPILLQEWIRRRT